MASWSEVEASAPALARDARAIFERHKHKILATLRADGSPRVSGIETTFAGGELYLGSMGGARKAQDLRRDPRLALHSSSDDPPEDDPAAWSGDAKLSGRAVEVTDDDVVRVVLGGAPPGPTHVFRVDVRELVVTRVAGDVLRIELWRPGRDVEVFERR